MLGRFDRTIVVVVICGESELAKEELAQRIIVYRLAGKHCIELVAEIARVLDNKPVRCHQRTTGGCI